MKCIVQYKDKKGCIWSKINSSPDSEWMYAIKIRDENGNKLYNWKPKRIKVEWLELIVD